MEVMEVATMVGMGDMEDMEDMEDMGDMVEIMDMAAITITEGKSHLFYLLHIVRFNLYFDDSMNLSVVTLHF